MGPKRDDVWRETGLLDRFPKGGPKVLWRAKLSWGYGGPAVADGLVYVLDYQTDANFKAAQTWTRPKPPLKGKERVLCLDAKTGGEVWKHEYDCPTTVSYPGPRCTPTVADGKVYTLGAEGNLYCLDARKGTVVWSKDFKKAYGAKTEVWGYAGHPLVDGKKLICPVGGKGGALMAFDKDTGKEIWKAVEAKELGYSPPTIVEAAGKRQLLFWTGEAIHALDPETGKPYWSYPLASVTAMSIMAPQKLGDFLFAGSRQNVSVLLKLDPDKPGATPVWKGDRDHGVGPINMTPFAEDGLIFGVDQLGPLTAVDVQTGKRLWSTTLPVTGKEKNPQGSATAFLVKNGDRFVIFAETGDLILAKLSRKGYEEIDRWKMLEPTSFAFNRNVVWSHPAFADKCVFARNDKEIVCASLAK
jgi:outer membrane protein assembly factor BamB